MKVLNRQQLGGAVVEPLGAGGGLAPGAVAVAARVVGDPLMAAPVALLDVPAQPCGAPADQVLQHAALLGRSRVPVSVQEGRRVVTQDVGQLQGLGRHCPCASVVAAPSRSSGLGVAATRAVETKVYRAVVRRLRWPSRAWMVRRSTPASSMCVAKE